MVDRLRRRILVSPSGDWVGREAERSRRQEVIQPFIEVTRSGLALDDRYAWIEISPPPSREVPPRPPEYFGCLGPNPVVQDTGECQARQIRCFTGHCTWCRLPSNYYCETDVCIGNEIPMMPNPGNLCYTFYDAGRRDEGAGRRNERFYELGGRTDLMASCCRCYRMGVDDQRRHNVEEEEESGLQT